MLWNLMHLHIVLDFFVRRADDCASPNDAMLSNFYFCKIAPDDGIRLHNGPGSLRVYR